MNNHLESFENRQPGEPMGPPQDLLERVKEYDEYIPLLATTLSFVDSYRNAKRPQARDAICDQLSLSLIKTPSRIADVLSNLSLIHELRPETPFRDIQRDLTKHLEQAAARKSQLGSWIPERIEDLVRTGLYGTEDVSQVVEKIKSALFNAPNTPENAVDLQYNAAWAMVQTSDPTIREELFSTLALEKSWFSERSLGALYFSLGGLSLYDATVVKQLAVGNALRSTGVLVETLKDGKYRDFSDRALSASDRVHKILAHLRERLIPQSFQEVRRTLIEIRKKDPKRFNELQSSLLLNPRVNERAGIKEILVDEIGKIVGGNYKEKVERLKAKEEEYKLKLFSRILVYDREEPLTKMAYELIEPFQIRTFLEFGLQKSISGGYEQLTQKSIQVADDVQLRVLAKDCESVEQRVAIVKEVYETLREGKSVNPRRNLYVDFDGAINAARDAIGFGEWFDDDHSIILYLLKTTPEAEVGKLSSILEQHRPLLSAEQISLIEEQLNEVRQEIKYKFTKSVNKRGYEVVVSDPALKNYGYQKIIYRHSLDDDFLHAHMIIDGSSYEYILDSDYRTVFGGDVRRFNTYQDQIWLELLVLSHLRPLLCTGEDEGELKTELVGGEKQYRLYRKQLGGRQEHLRHLLKGRGYSPEAYDRYFESDLYTRYGKSLFEINEERRCNLETGMWTYVRPSEKVDLPNSTPIRIAFKDATEDMRKVIDLGKVSEEELKRIEAEILGELEIN